MAKKTTTQAPPVLHGIKGRDGIEPGVWYVAKDGQLVAAS